MDELKGKYVNVVLSVEEGKGMDFTKQPLTLVANFNSRILESDPAAPEECPAFNTELVWEVEKRSLRNIRSANAPLRVEVYTTDKKSNRKDRIGFVLLSLRSARVIARGSKKQDAPFKWHKLMGVPHEFKCSHPELYLCHTIRDSVAEDEDGSTFFTDMVEDLYKDTKLSLDNEFGSDIPITYLEDGYIQVGKDKTNMQPYVLNIVVKQASNLDVLLPEVLVFNKAKGTYHISFALFGILIKSKAFRRNLHETVELNEKIVISLMSDFETLKEFFTQHHQILVNFHSSEDKLAMTKINVEKLISEVDEHEFQNKCNFSRSLEEKCYFWFPSPNGIVPEGANSRKPFIEVETTLEQKKISNKAKKDAEISEEMNTVKVKKTSSLNKTVDACGDVPSIQIKMPDIVLPKTDRKAQSTPEISPRREAKPATKSTDNVLKDIPYVSPTQSVLDLPTPSLQDASEPLSHYIKYCLTVNLQEIKFRSLKQTKSFYVRFKHPQAATTLTLKQEIANYTGDYITLNDVKCKSFFMSTPGRIKNVVYAWPPKLTILSEYKINMSKEIDLKTGILAQSESSEYRYIEKLVSVEDGEHFCSVAILLHLSRYGSELSRHDLWPMVLDERIAINAVAELEEWKSKQRVQFEEDLKMIEDEHIKKLHRDYLKRKEELEKKIDKNVKKCKILIQQLKMGANNLKIKRALERKKKQQEYNFEDEVDKNINKYSGFEYRELVEKICSLEQENDNLKEMIREQSEQIQTYEKCALTKEQTSSLLKELRVLEEQFEEAQKQKSFFKEEWKKAVKEIHELREEDRKHLLNQIQLNREQLSQLSLDDYNCDSNESTPRN